MPQVRRIKSRSLSQRRKVHLPGLGKDQYTYIRKFPASVINTHKRLVEKLDSGDSTAESLAGLCVLGACDSQGKPVFTEADIETLVDWPLDTLVTLANEIAQYNGLMGDTAKNLPTSRRGVSRSR